LVVLMSCGDHFSPQFLSELARFCPSIAAAPAIFIRVSQCPTSTLVLWVVML
jgi:hypothetical protein